VCGIVRNVAKNFQKNYNQLRLQFEDKGYGTYWYFYENDSVDGTQKILIDNGEQHDNFRYDTDILKTTNWGRVAKLQRAREMCGYRNKYLQRLQQLDYAFDYVVIVDMDFTTLNISQLDVAMSYDADMVGANGRMKLELNGLGVYYDRWALEGLPHRHVDNLNAKSAPPKVLSCFGGVGLYKAESLRECWYDPNMAASPNADHGTLHAAMRKAGHTKMYICPPWIVWV